MNMEKEFIPYEQALALKELGFDEPCFGLYHNDKTFYPTQCKSHEQYHGQICSAPLRQQAFRWFREKYSISYSIDWMTRDSKYYSGYYVHFRGINGNKLNRENFIVLNDELPPTKDAGYGVYKTYEEAELACLKKLIEIVKEK